MFQLSFKHSTKLLLLLFKINLIKIIRGVRKKFKQSKLY